MKSLELKLELVLSRQLWERGEKGGTCLQKQVRLRALCGVVQWKHKIKILVLIKATQSLIKSEKFTGTSELSSSLSNGLLNPVPINVVRYLLAAPMLTYEGK